MLLVLTRIMSNLLQWQQHISREWFSYSRHPKALSRFDICGNYIYILSCVYSPCLRLVWRGVICDCRFKILMSMSWMCSWNIPIRTCLLLMMLFNTESIENIWEIREMNPFANLNFVFWGFVKITLHIFRVGLSFLLFFSL